MRIIKFTKYNAYNAIHKIHTMQFVKYNAIYNNTIHWLNVIVYTSLKEIYSVQCRECNALTLMNKSHCIEYKALSKIHCIVVNCVMKHRIHCKEYNAYHTIY